MDVKAIEVLGVTVVRIRVVVVESNVLVDKVVGTDSDVLGTDDVISEAGLLVDKERGIDVAVGPTGLSQDLFLQRDRPKRYPGNSNTYLSLQCLRQAGTEQ